MEDYKIVINIEVGKNTKAVVDFIIKIIKSFKRFRQEFGKNYRDYKPKTEETLSFKTARRKFYIILFFFLFALFFILFIGKYLSEEEYLFLLLALGFLFLIFLVLTTVYLTFYLITIFFSWIKAVFRSFRYAIKDALFSLEEKGKEDFHKKIDYPDPGSGKSGRRN